MHDWYQMPALFLTALLLPAFGHLYFRTRDTRSLFWFLAFAAAVVRMALLYPAAGGDFILDSRPWVAAITQSCAIVSSTLFLASLSPLAFRFGRVRILYAVPYTIPLVAFAVLAHGVYHNVIPGGPISWVFPALGLAAALAGLLWAAANGTGPGVIASVAGVFLAGLAFWSYFRTGLYWPLVLAEAANHFITAVLVISVFRRFSTGVLVSVLGFVVWSLPVLLLFPMFHAPWINLILLRLIVMAKVAAALGLIILALESELAANKLAGDRERRIRRELEAYHGLTLSRRRVEDFDRQANEICAVIAANSRFSGVALLLLDSAGTFRLAGSAGIEPAIARALNTFATRLPIDGLFENAPPAVEGSHAVAFDLKPWLAPGDDLERLRFTSVTAALMNGRSGHEGVLLLSGLRTGRELGPLRADDLVPVEMLAARLQSVRSQTRMLEKLVDSEKFAGIGQLASNVTHQLNNPLTVILGYTSLLAEARGLEEKDRKAVDSILAAARTMRSTLASLQRVASSPVMELSAVSISELLKDLEQLHRPEFLYRSIEFRLQLAPDLPRVLCQEQQLRQAVLHGLQFAMDAMDRVPAETARTVRLEATAEAQHVQILIAHNGPGFQHPERAFDPFAPTQPGAGETMGLGLSLCASILRNNGGNASAVNLEPRGAAIVLELKAA